MNIVSDYIRELKRFGLYERQQLSLPQTMVTLRLQSLFSLFGRQHPR